jgi:salicylate 1-O-methyltransferase
MSPDAPPTPPLGGDREATRQSVPVRPAPPGPGPGYTRSSPVPAAGLLPAAALFENAATHVELPPSPQPIWLADYGAAAGHNSLRPTSAAIDLLRKRVEHERPICVVHTDIAENDFTALFQTLSRDPDTYLGHDAAAFAMAVGRSFYQQILPSKSVTLGWSAWATQWLSRAPAPIGDHVQIAYSADQAARAAYARQGAEDWITFLSARSREMRPGARLVVVTMALDEEGNFGYRPVLDAIMAELTDLTREGLLHEHEVERMVIPTVGRSHADLTAPFVPKGRFEGLTIEHLEVFNAQDEYWERYQSNRDAALLGARWTAFARASVFPTLAAALDGGRTDPRLGRFFDRLDTGVAARLAAAPQRLQLPLANVVLVKQSWPR